MEVDIWMLIMLLFVFSITSFICSILGKYFADRYFVAMSTSSKKCCRRHQQLCVAHYHCCLHESKKDNSANIVRFDRENEIVDVGDKRKNKRNVVAQVLHNEFEEVAADMKSTFSRLGINNDSKTYMQAARQLENRNLSPMVTTPSPNKKSRPVLNFFPSSKEKNPKQRLRFFEANRIHRNSNVGGSSSSNSNNNNNNKSNNINNNNNAVAVVNNKTNGLSNNVNRSKVTEAESSSYLNNISKNAVYTSILGGDENCDEVSNADCDGSVFSDDVGHGSDDLDAELTMLLDADNNNVIDSNGKNDEVVATRAIPPTPFAPGNSGIPSASEPSDFVLVDISTNDNSVKSNVEELVKNQDFGQSAADPPHCASMKMDPSMAGKCYSHPLLAANMCRHCHRFEKMKMAENFGKHRKHSSVVVRTNAGEDKQKRRIRSVEDNMVDSIFAQNVNFKTPANVKKSVIVHVDNVRMSDDKSRSGCNNEDLM